MECKQNEEFRDCGNGCGDLTCKSKFANCNGRRCVSHLCAVDCFCKEGFVRNDDWECIPVEECPENSKSQEFINNSVLYYNFEPS